MKSFLAETKMKNIKNSKISRNFLRKAFTLIELLVVIVIIGILSTIAVATFSRYFRDARNTQRLVVIRQYVDALKRMNAVGQKFPLTIGEGNSREPNIVCLTDYEDGNCWHWQGADIGMKFSPKVKSFFNEHLEGVENTSSITFSTNNKQDGIIYRYPVYQTWGYNINLTNRFNLDIKKTAKLRIIMEGKDYPCEKIYKYAVPYEAWTNKEETTYCVTFIEDKN